MSAEKMYIGLDIGTDSVGYAVTNESYDVLKFHGEPAWGVTLFDEANLSAERRSFRTARRRLARRQQRAKLLQELFAPAITKIDPRFFIRLQDSALSREDTQEKYSLFDDLMYTDKEYYQQYPTIHHLISELMTSNDPHDIRLIYLACAWLVTHRGHFLNEIDKNNINNITSFDAVYSGLIAYLGENGYTVPWNNCDISAFQQILHERITISGKYKKLVRVCFPSGKAPKADAEIFPYGSEAVLKALCGSVVKAKDIFPEHAEEYAEIRSFSLGSKDEELAEVLSELGDDAELIVRLKAIYDWALLVDILGSCPSISHAKVLIYEQHKADLLALKNIIRKYIPEKYNEVFRAANPDCYTAYAYHGELDELKGKASQEAFCAYIKKLISGINPDVSDKPAYNDMLSRLELGTFMPKQKNTDNRVIPYQLYWHELDAVLKHAQTYLPFLTVKDVDGLSVSDKIRSIMTFRIPYFVGPLNNSAADKHSHAWLIRKAEKIYPWNFESVVDLDASEQEFIRRMTNTCTYLPGEKVLPKGSLLYRKFTVLNEINNLRVNGEQISVSAKQAIYGVFMSYRRVTLKKLRDFMLSNNLISKNDELSGIDITIKSDLKPWHDFKKLLDEKLLTLEQVEEIIEQRTYSEDKTRFSKWLDREYAFLSSADRRYIANLDYKDFGRMSARFLNGLEGVDKQTGEVYTILRALWDTNYNLMQLLSDRFTFADEIANAQKEYYSGHPRTFESRLEEMYISNAVKRPIIRSLEIVKEVVKAFKRVPDKIFVEMARGGSPEQKNRRTQSRREQIEALYKKCRDEDVRVLTGQLERMGDEADSRLQSEKLFLYYMQLGKCMYTGQPINLEQLMSGKLYDVDHIYPQSKVKDDSIINNKVLVLSEANGLKGDTYPIAASVRAKMLPYWDKLKSAGLISDEKYKRLTRATGFSDDEKWGFINRQLTETSQSTKAVATLLGEMYPNTQIVYVKARLASEFRQEFDCIKSRLYNDLHHAKDAYLNIVVGNVYNMRFTRSWFSVSDTYSLNTRTLFTRPLTVSGELVWDGVPMKDKAVAYMRKNNIHLTKYAYCKKGGLFDQMPLKAREGLLPRKGNLPAAKYGGYNKPSVSFFVLTRYFSDKKNEVMLLPVELRIAEQFRADEAFARQYALDRIGSITGKPVQQAEFLLNGRILKINTLLSFDGFEAGLAGVSSGGRQIILNSMMSFVANPEVERYLKRLESLIEKLDKNKQYVFDEKHDGVSAADNQKLYALYLDKAENSVFKKRVNMPLSVLSTGKAAFEKLSATDQARVLLNIHLLFNRMANGGCDLSRIGGAGKAGATLVSSSISNWKKNYSDVRILDRSASGLWEAASENLLSLL